MLRKAQKNKQERAFILLESHKQDSINMNLIITIVIVFSLFGGDKAYEVIRKNEGFLSKSVEWQLYHSGD